jgi:putative OmpL-like beta-barrel porin-2
MRFHRAFCLSRAVFVCLGLARPSAAQPVPSPEPTPPPAAASPASDFTALRMSGFLLGSVSYNSKLQMVPEFAGGTPALSNPGAVNFGFDKVGLSFARMLAPWLTASAAIEVESHRDRHSHGFDPDFGCFGEGPCVERFGAEEPSVEVNLDRFNVTAVAPAGNGIAFSLGRFDVPFGIERHDEVLLTTATTSEVFRYARPQRMTGVQVAYTFGPAVDVAAWVVNRWESETSGAEDPNDVNEGKSLGGRLGLTPMAHERLLNFGLGGFLGPEQEGGDSPTRWVVSADGTWAPSARSFVATEWVWGGEDGVEMRERGTPIAAPAETVDAGWKGFYVLGHHDVLEELGITLRYGWLDDEDGARTGVAQKLSSWTFTPVVHLSRLVHGLRSTGAAFARTRHPIDVLDLKLEYRLNKSDRTVFSAAEPAEDVTDAGTSSHQVQLQLAWNF